MRKATVAIVGRPNVGKSTLFNKIVGTRVSIVDDTPGVTRDRIYMEAEWTGRRFMLIDTGGIEPATDDEILKGMRTQAEIAIERADCVILMTNIHEGLTAADADVAAMLMKAGKPTVLAVNKVDSGGQPPMDFYEFYNLGLGDPVAISSTHGLGVGDLLDEVFAKIPEELFQENEDDSGSLRVAIVGKPNAGKSSLVNQILGEERVIVSDVAGTTRDAVDTSFEKDGKTYTLVDTAGMRKRGKVDEGIERYSVLRSLSAVDNCDVCVIVVDANEGISEQDSKIAGYAHEKGKASIIAVNKWDLIEKDTNTMKQFREKVNLELGFMLYAPQIYISALTGQRVGKLFELINFVHEQNSMRIKTGMLNDVLGEATMKVQPPSDKGKRLKIYYMTQASTCPPTFVVFVNDKELMHFSYLRYLENQIRGVFGLEGTPVRFIVRERKNEKTKGSKE
ncbi:ribosome biogenesis GTPase Der [Congzhengia minquanensis]|uniref:GTPase Der n=1 Tax=Congzhengia minquanensis TaxID=2763657 RepID=A0A926DNM0_9FIRM|nr:ribosome biogenesis GTPase Der [Congzhengia minquanensis]MBC8541166.1 ribosome biogenesis GTPase Der [Congzhengia minquanensis]